MTDKTTKYRCLLASCIALYGPLFGPSAAWGLWCATR